ncbi:hypothetical protein QOT17_002081 [Balamuthia mandrillaris]
MGQEQSSTGAGAKRARATDENEPEQEEEEDQPAKRHKETDAAPQPKTLKDDAEVEEERKKAEGKEELSAEDINWEPFKRHCFVPCVRLSNVLTDYPSGSDLPGYSYTYNEKEEEEEEEEDENAKSSGWPTEVGSSYCEAGQDESGLEELRISSPSGMSRFGGVRPFLPEGETWPECDQCALPLTFLFQLHASDLPAVSADDPKELLNQLIPRELWEECSQSKLLQGFACGDCYSSGDGMLVRLLDAPLLPSTDKDTLKRRAAEALLISQPEGEESSIPQTIPEELRQFVAKVERARRTTLLQASPPLVPSDMQMVLKREWEIVGWRKYVDYPPTQLMEAVLGVHDVISDEQHVPKRHTKFSGWPCCFAAGAHDPPCCTHCSEPMRRVMALEEGPLLPFQWGDAGVATVYQCQVHRDTFTLTWDDPSS